MRDNTVPDNINELKIWLDGRFDLIAAGQKRSEEDLRQVRQRVHDLSNDVAKITALDLQGKFDAIKAHDEKLEKLDGEAISAKAALATIKALWGVGGTAVGAAGAIILEIAKVIHP